MLKKIWNDPVWSKVIAAGILAAFVVIGTYFLDWWPMIGHYLSESLAFFLAKSLVPNWLWVTLALLAIPMALLLIGLGWSLFRPDTSSIPNWKSYTTDNFFGLRWRWRWQYLNNTMSDMQTYCPHCDFQVYPNNASAYVAVDRISFYCESCNWALARLMSHIYPLKIRHSDSLSRRFAMAHGILIVAVRQIH